jgi:hypothetical protein
MRQKGKYIGINTKIPGKGIQQKTEERKKQVTRAQAHLGNAKMLSSIHCLRSGSGRREKREGIN